VELTSSDFLHRLKTSSSLGIIQAFRLGLLKYSSLWSKQLPNSQILYLNNI
ncbi:hypothetical protein STEG23_005417, partial [Scotinomys teguina]